MTLQTWIADELRAEGLTVHETADWKTRQTRDGFAPQGAVAHDTVTPPGMSLAAEQDILIKGRPDLKGPLAQTGGHRDGSISVIAAGRCNHNGGVANDGIPDPLWGNDAFGHEVFCLGGTPGRVEPWNQAQRDSADVLFAVYCRHFGWPASRVQGHKETDPKRKIDPFAVDEFEQRARVDAILRGEEPPGPTPPTTGRFPKLTTVFFYTNSRYYLLIPDAVWAEIDGATALDQATKPTCHVVTFKDDEAQQRVTARLNKKYGDPTPLTVPA